MVCDLVKKYGDDNVFNADETGLFYRLLPDRSLCTRDHVAGSKKSKERLTILACTNASGTYKSKLIIVGKSANPKGLKKEKFKKISYYSNKKAWMVSSIFEEFVRELDRSLRVPSALILDNASVHNSAADLRLKNLEIVFLPPNTTSKTQPMDAGIIQTLKLKYRKQMIEKVSILIERESSE
jgi:hypothetical protein